MIETERLLIRLPRLEDAPDLAIAYAEPETVRYIGDGTTATEEDVEQGISRWLERWDDNGCGPFSIIRQEDGRWLGRSGLLAGTSAPGRTRRSTTPASTRSPNSGGRSRGSTGVAATRPRLHVRCASGPTAISG